MRQLARRQTTEKCYKYYVNFICAPFLNRLPIISGDFPILSATEIVTETHYVVPSESQVQRGIVFTAEIVAGMPHVVPAESQVLTEWITHSISEV